MTHMQKSGARARLLATTLLAGLATVGPVVGGAVLATLATSGTASAQAMVQGVLVGTVRNQAGAAIPGASVVVTSKDQGLSRTLVADQSGQFRALALPSGSYTVAVTAAGFQPLSADAFVALGGASSYTFTLQSDDTAVEAIVVTGASRAVSAFDSTTTGLAVDVSETARLIPVVRSAASIALLVPGVTQSDSAFGNIPTIGGSSAGENTYVVNGLNITKFREFTGSSTVPFEFYKTLEVKTGGYSSEFGRGTGGVLNAVTKSGGNEWEFEITSYVEPDVLFSKAKNTYLSNNDKDYRQNSDVILQAGGPIIKDRLFIYGLYNHRYRKSYDLGANSIGNRTRSTDPFWGGKVDFVINDNHRVDVTVWSDDITDETTQTTTYSSGRVNTDGVSKFRYGGTNWIGRYTGVWADWLTTSLAYGVNEYNESLTSASDSKPFITTIAGYDADGDGKLEANVGVAFPLGAINGQPSTNKDRREILRFDVDAYANFFGEHHFRFGIDQEKLESKQQLDYSGKGLNYCRPGGFPGGINCTNQVTGGLWYRYQTPFTSATVPTGRTDLVGKARRVRVRAYDNDGGWAADQNAYYLQDSWEVTDRLTLNLGIRNETFKNKNVAGVAFVDMKNQWAPRLGFTYDVFGDRSSKFFGFYGKYFLPVAVNTNQRLAGKEFFISDTWNLDVTTGGPNDANRDGINDKTLEPILGSLVAPGTNADGTVRPIATQVDKNLDPMYVDEYILGYEKDFGRGWTAGVSLTYRNIGTAIDDVAIDAAVLKYCAAQKISGCDSVWSGFHQYVLTNPGEDMTITLDKADLAQTSLGAAATSRVVNLSASDLNYPAPKREYIALQATIERKFDGKWGGRFSYVASETKGNYEGALKSDNGQTDPGLSQDFDQPGLVDFAYGKLPGHRAHSFKLFGTYSPIEGLLLGGNAVLESPRNFGCIGVHPTDAFAAQYGAASWFCNGKPTPRGSQFKSGWLKNVDLTVSYTLPDTVMGGALSGLSLRADVFNLFNLKSELDFNEFGELTAVGELDPNYGKVTRYQSPRYVRLGVSYKF